MYLLIHFSSFFRWADHNTTGIRDAKILWWLCVDDRWVAVDPDLKGLTNILFPKKTSFSEKGPHYTEQIIWREIEYTL